MRGWSRFLYLVVCLALAGASYEASAASSAGLCQIGFHPSTTVSSASALKAALSNASAGTTIVVKGGNYSGDFTLTKSGTATRPITIRGSGTVTFKNSVFSLKGSYGVITGMTFDNGMVSVFGDYNRVTGNVFKNGRTGGNNSKLHSAAHTEGGARYNRIDHNEVVNWQRRAIRNTRLSSRTQDNRFDHNYVHKMLGARANSGEAFQVGTGHGDPRYTPKTIIEYNLVDGHNIESEVISLKANGNIVRANTFMNASQGNVQARSGKDNLFINNTLIGLESLGIYGDNNKVIGNRLVKTKLRIRSGNALWPELLIKTSDGKYKYAGAHPTARNTMVAGNDLSGGDIQLGLKGKGGGYNRSFATENTMLAGNLNYNLTTAGSVKSTKPNASYNGEIGKAVQMKVSQVGPGAADPLCEDVPLHIALAAPQALKVIVVEP